MKRTNRLVGRSAIRGFAHVLSGSIGAQVITFASLPILSRLYSPDIFGVYSLILALVALLSPAITLRFETAALLPKQIEEVRALVWNATLSIVALSVLYGAALQLLAKLEIGDLPTSPGLPWWVAGLTLLGGFFILLSQLALRKQEYSLVGRRTLLRSSATSATQIGFGVVANQALGLILGTVAGSALGITTMARRTKEFWFYPGFQELANSWKKYWRFPGIFAPSSLFNSIGLQVPLIFFTIWFGVAAGGQLGMAERIIGAPLVLVGAAVGQMIDAEVSKRLRDGRKDLLALYLKLTTGLAVLGSLVAVAFGAFGTKFIPWILGDQWQQAGMIVQILAITGAVRLVVSPLSKFLLLLQKSFANIVLDIFRVLVVGSAMGVSVYFDVGMTVALWLVYSALTLTYLITWVYCAVIVRQLNN